MKIAVIAIVALLSGCEMLPPQTTPAPAPPVPQEDFGSSVWRRLNTGLSLFYGLPIQSAVTMFGYPTSDRIVLGDHVYTWESVTEMPGFNIGDPPLRLFCRIDIGTTLDGTIKNTHSDGVAGGCARYANTLTPR